MPAALPFASLISQSSQAKTSYKIIEVKYGNGYSQRAGDGFNNAQASWNVAWENIDSSTFTSLINALDSAGGVDYFTWLAPGDLVTKKFIIKEHSRSALAGSVFAVSATLEQCFDL